jgi:hypothetical protein
MGALVVCLAPPALAMTCTPGGPPDQSYCADTSWSFDGTWTNVGVTISEESPGQSVPYNWAGIYENEGPAGWVNVSAQLCPDSASCSTFFSTQDQVPSSQFAWLVFAAEAPGQVIPGSYKFGSF